MIRNTPPTPREHASRWVRAHSPLQSPRLRAAHLLLGLVLLALLVIALGAGGLMAEVARMHTHPESWRVTVVWIEAVAVLCLWALVGVRAMHPLMYVALGVQVVFLALWLGLVRIEQLPFTVINAALLVVLTLIPVRIITRPNDQDRVAQAEQQRDEALAELARLKGEV